MALKRIGMALLIGATIIMLYTAFCLEKKEMVEIDYNGGSAYFTRYSCKGLDILAASQGENILKVHIAGITEKKLELIGIMKCNAGEYVAAAYQAGVKLYAPDGELMAQYKPEDKESKVISSCISDIDGDSNEELLIIEGSGKEFYGDKLLILSWDNGIKKVYDREFKELNPWKIQACEVDGDGRLEIALGVYKEANFHPVMAKRPFLYHWNGEDIVPVWRGSRLSRPFDDYIFLDLDADGKDELTAIEMLPDGKRLINAYKWSGFGFESVAESGHYEDIIEIVKQYKGKESLFIKVKEGKGQTWAELEKVNERLVEKAESNKIIISK